VTRRTNRLAATRQGSTTANRPNRCGREEGSNADVDALAETFGFEFTTLEACLREHGREDKEEPAVTPGRM
jgi:hypothetical protein